MTALSNDIQRPFRLPPGGLRTKKVLLAGYTNYASGSTAYTVYKGAIIVCDVSDTDGYFAPYHANGATGDMSGGIALERQVVDSSLAADGSAALTVAANGVWGFPKGSIAITDIGATVYVTTDDNTITLTSSNAVTLGILEDVDDTYAWVNIDPYFMRPIA